MALHSELPVYKAAYDLLLTVFQFVKDFSREYKYSVGDALKGETMALMTLLFRANTRLDRVRAGLASYKGLLQHHAAHRFTARRLALLRPTSSKMLYPA